MENKKSNTNVKTTMDFFKQKRAKANNKKLFSHIEINSDNNNNKPSFATSADFNSTNQSIYKSDIFQIDTYLNKVKLDNNTFISHYTYLFLVQKDIDINNIQTQESEVSSTIFVDKKKYNALFNNKEMVEAIKYCNKVLDYMN